MDEGIYLAEVSPEFTAQSPPFAFGDSHIYIFDLGRDDSLWIQDSLQSIQAQIGDFSYSKVRLQVRRAKGMSLNSTFGEAVEQGRLAALG